VTAANRPSRTDDGSLAGRKKETTRSTRTLRGRRRMPDAADTRARRHTQLAAARPLARRTSLTPSTKPRLPQASPSPQRPNLITKRPRADGILLTKRPRKIDNRGTKGNSASHATSNRHRTGKSIPRRRGNDSLYRRLNRKSADTAAQDNILREA